MSSNRLMSLAVQPLRAFSSMPSTTARKQPPRLQLEPEPTILPFNKLRDRVLLDLENDASLHGMKWNRFPGLNSILKGHRRGELTVVTGPTGSGKTTFLSEYSLDLAMSGVKTLWGSFEIMNVRLCKLLLNQMARLKLEDNLHLFNQVADNFSRLPIFFMDFHGQTTLTNVIDTMSAGVANYDVHHILIDNLQFMIGSYDKNYKNISDRFHYQDIIVSSFRKFATENHCHVTLVIHPRKENSDELNNMSIFGGGKAIQEADNVIILQSKYSTNSLKYKKYLQVTKNRFDGDLGIIPLSFNRESGGFGSETKDDMHDPAKQVAV